MIDFSKKDENGRLHLPLETEPIYYKLDPGTDVINFYFYKNGKKYFFKSNSRFTLDTTELFAMQLANKAGLNSIEMIPAVFTYEDEKFYGLLSEDFVEKYNGSEILNSKNILSVFKQSSETNNRFNTLEHHVMALKIFRKQSNNNLYLDYIVELDPNLLLELKKQLVFSYVIADQDCHAHNIEYLLKNNKENNKKIVTVAPLFDNSMSFLIKSFKANPIGLVNKYKDEANKKMAVDYLLNYVNFPLQVKKESKDITNRKELAPEIANLIINDKNLLEFYNNLSKINAKKLFNELKENNNYNFITEKEIELASMVVESSVKTLDHHIKLEKIKKTGPIRHL